MRSVFGIFVGDISFTVIILCSDDNIIGNLAQQSATITPQPPIQIKELVATIESPRSAMAIHTTFSITYWRDANMALSFNATQYSEGWKIV